MFMMIDPQIHAPCKIMFLQKGPKMLGQGFAWFKRIASMLPWVKIFTDWYETVAKGQCNECLGS